MKNKIVLASVAQLAGESFNTPMVAGSISGQGTFKRQLIDASLSPSP